MTATREEGSIVFGSEKLLNTYDTPTDFPGTSDPNAPFDAEAFAKGITCTPTRRSADGMELEFDLIGCDAPIANAIRRVLIAEVPSMAFEKVYLYQNTSLIQDEVLCHRIGLLPLNVDHRQFVMPTIASLPKHKNNADVDKETVPNENEAIIFSLKIECTVNRQAAAGATDPVERFHNSRVLASDLKWEPIGDQATRFAGKPPALVHSGTQLHNIQNIQMNDDILIAKMRPGQEIELRVHAVKGIGRDHAKFSPVATATYRLLPTIKLLRDVVGEPAQRFQKSFSDGVISLVTGEDGQPKAHVADARKDMCSRNVLRFKDLADSVEMGRKKNHFLFSIESTGAMTSAQLLLEACTVMQLKCRRFAAAAKLLCEE